MSVPPTPPASPSLGLVLVVGGCGFLGFHIVRLLLEEPACASVHVLSRNPTLDRRPNAFYYTCDIADIDRVCSIFVELQPNIVIHTAALSGRPNLDQALPNSKVTIDSTSNLISCAAQTSSVTAFVTRYYLPL